MPQAWFTVTPCLSRNASSIAGGQAEPPITVRFMVLSLSALASMCESSICHTVGTPAENVTFSCSNRS